MALQTSGQITLEDIAVELGRPGTQVSLQDADVLALANKSAGAEISLTDFYGKSVFSPFTLFDPANTFGTGVVDEPTRVSNTRVQAAGNSRVSPYGYVVANTDQNFITKEVRFFVYFADFYPASYPNAEMQLYDVRNEIDLSVVPESAKSGKIRVVCGQSYASFNGGPEYSGEMGYINSAAGRISIFSGYSETGVNSSGTSKPNDITYGSQGYGYFVSNNTVQQYLDSSQAFELYLRHITGGSGFGSHWSGGSGNSGDRDEFRIRAVDIVPSSTTSGFINGDTSGTRW